MSVTKWVLDTPVTAGNTGTLYNLQAGASLQIWPTSAGAAEAYIETRAVEQAPWVKISAANSTASDIFAIASSVQAARITSVTGTWMAGAAQ